MSIRSFTLGRLLVQLIHHSAGRCYTACSASCTTLLIPPAISRLLHGEGKKTVVLAEVLLGMEAAEHLKGVSDVVSGYSGGSAATADYGGSSERRGMLRQ